MRDSSPKYSVIGDSQPGFQSLLDRLLVCALGNFPGPSLLICKLLLCRVWPLRSTKPSAMSRGIRRCLCCWESRPQQMIRQVPGPALATSNIVEGREAPPHSPGPSAHCQPSLV